MANYKELTKRYLDRVDIKYTDLDDEVLRVSYAGDNLKSIPIMLFYDKNGDDDICLKCWDILKFSKEKWSDAIIACNMLNKKYRWVKFYIDDDYDIVASLDAYIDEITCGEECLNLVRRMVHIIDEAYLALMRANWS